MQSITICRLVATTLCVASCFTGCSSDALRNKISLRRPFANRNERQQRHEVGSYQQQIAEGKVAENSKNWHRAEQIYKKLIEAEPDRPGAYHRIGVVYDYQQEYDRAQENFSQAIRINPTNAEIWSDLGYCLFLKGELEQAESAFVKAVKLAPGTTRIHNNLGMVYAHLDRPDDALAEFQHGTNEADALFNLAYIYSSCQETEKATACIERCLSIEPKHKNAKRALKKLRDPKLSAVEAVSYEEGTDASVHWIPYVDGMENQQATIMDTQPAAASANLVESHSANRHAGKRVRQLQAKTQAMMRRRMNQQSHPGAASLDTNQVAPIQSASQFQNQAGL